MQDFDAIRAGEARTDLPDRVDASLVFIGVIRTPWTHREDCPRQGRLDGPICRVEVDERWRAALEGVEEFERLEIFYWLHQSRRDLVLQSPGDNGRVHGTFALRSPVRPNPIGAATVALIARENATLLVRGLDCVDRTPLIDIKPDCCRFSPQAAPRASAS